VHVTCARLTLLAVLFGAPASAQSPPCAACALIELDATQAAALAAIPELDGLPLLLRPGAPAAPELEQTLATLRERRARVGLVTSLDAVAAATPLLGQLSESGAVVVQVPAGPDIERIAFELKKTAADLRARRGDAVLALEPDAALLAPLLDRGIAAYFDVLVVPPGADLSQLARRGELSRDVWQRAPAAATLADVLEQTARAGGRQTVLRLAGGEPATAADLIAALARVRGHLPAGLTPLPELTVSCDVACAADVYLNPQTLTAVAVVRAETPVGVLTSSSKTAAIQPIGVTLPATGTFVAVITGWQEGESARFSEDVRVQGTRTLSVREIIARHHAAVARQALLVRTLVSSGRMVLTFEVPGFAAPVTITSDIVTYTTPQTTEMEQRTIRVNGLDFLQRGDGVPRLPIIEPERVSTPPLAITLGAVYEYRLAGRDTVDGRDCYVVEFTPRDPKQTLFKGRAWITSDTFAMVRVAAVQTNLRGPITSSEQRDEYAPVEKDIWLLKRSEVNQFYEGPGHRTPIHRTVLIDRHDVNPADFADRRTAAMASNSVILRDTPQGFRYLRRRDAGESGDAPARELAGRSERIRTFIFGVIIDPNINRPLPFAGLNYVDFNFLRTGTQLSAFYGGTYGQLAWAAPSIKGSRWQMFGKAFGTAFEYNDRSFRNGIEIYGENVRQRPLHAELGIVRPLTPRVRTRIAYELDYTHFDRASFTDRRFEVPVSQLIHAARVLLEGQRGPWTANVWWNPGRRQRWVPWGRPGGIDFSGEHTDFQRYGATLIRALVLSPTVVGSIETSWMAGHDLDRFSRFTFGSFDNRLRGYPSALIRYDKGAVARGVMTWNPGALARFDGFVDVAVVRDPGFGPKHRGYPGLGAALEAPMPFGVLLAVEWGYGVKARTSDGRLGTHVVRISAFKLF